MDTPYGIGFARSIFNRIRGAPWDLQPGVEREREIVNRVQLDVKAAVPERQAPRLITGELPRRAHIRRSVELVSYGYTNQCIGCQHAKLGLKLTDHSEESCARIVRHMPADEALNQRVQIAQELLVDRAPQEVRTGNTVQKPPQKNFRSEEQVEEQTSDGTVAQCRKNSSSSSTSSSSTTIPTSWMIDV